jgi:DNA-binding MarR family transcriptional regulator
MTNSYPRHPREDTDRPLDHAEESVWRALARALIVLPRVLGTALEEAHGLTMTEYFVLVNLSEEPDGAIRMTELADRGSLSLSGMTRVVDRMVRDGLVERVRCQSDARGYLAVLTEPGLARLRQAYPTHLRTVRENVVDHLAGLDLCTLAERMGRFAESEAGPPVGVPGTPAEAVPPGA